jgi:MOSC domain-containing protein YiiM
MTAIKGTVDSLYVGSPQIDDIGKQVSGSITLELDGIVGDRHRGLSREAWEHDKQPEGTVRRNERHWSAVSLEELAEITAAMDSIVDLTAADLGANICLKNIPNLSQLPKGSVLKFSSGVELIVEEYNPPCIDMGEKLAKTYTDSAGNAFEATAFSQAAKFTRGVVGVVEVPGTIKAGDQVEVTVYQPPIWLSRLQNN